MSSHSYERSRHDREDRYDSHRRRRRRDDSQSPDHKVSSSTRQSESSERRTAIGAAERDDRDGRRDVRHRHDRHRHQEFADDDSYRRQRKHEGRQETSYRDRSRSRDRSRHQRRSRSPPSKRKKRSYSESRSPPRRSRAPLLPQDESFRGETGLNGSGAQPPEKQKPNYKPTGLLAKEANTVAGTSTVLKYHEPPEARKPAATQQWRMYVFKGQDLLDTISLHQRSAWLVGRDQHVTDLLLEHPSISKQHAVIQFRHITTTNEFGDKTSRVKPYLIDLESANGTKLNGKRVEASKFVELIDQDVVAFGESEREYVLMLPPADV